MKNPINILICALLILAVSVTCAYSQSDPPTLNREATLMGDGLESGGYGGLEFRMTNISGENGALIGARGGWIINSSISLGAGGYGIITNHIIGDYEIENAEDYDSTVYLNGGYGGLFIEYINSSNSLVHFTANTLIGAGGITYSSKMNFEPKEGSRWKSHETSPFFVIEPGVTIDINIASFFRIGIGGSWRFISGLDLTETTDRDMTGFSGCLIFKFGNF